MVYLKELTDVIEAKIKKSDTYSPYKNEKFGAYYIYPDKKVEKVLCCVTSSEKVVQYAKENGYDLIISHHPIMTKKDMFPQLIYHTAADCSSQFGLNSYWKNFLGLKKSKHFDLNLGEFGFIEKISFKNLKDKIQTQLESPIIGDIFNSQQDIESICICTGLGGIVNDKALKTNSDVYILGQSLVSAKETGFRNVIEIGHSLSERIFYNCLKEITKNINIQLDMVSLNLDTCEKIYGESYNLGPLAADHVI